MQDYPQFSAFRNLMTAWDECVYWEGVQDQVRMLLDGQNLIFFFTKNKEFFGAPEDSRVTFARMKNPDADSPAEWGDEATFLAVNLSKALTGAHSMAMFSKKDLKAIKVVDKEKIEDALLVAAKKDDVPSLRTDPHPLKVLVAHLPVATKPVRSKKSNKGKK